MAPLAPSSLLLGHLVERAYSLGLKRFDFMLGDEPYKARWATEERQTVNLVVGAPTLRGQAAFAALVGAQQARRGPGRRHCSNGPAATGSAGHRH